MAVLLILLSLLATTAADNALLITLCNMKPQASPTQYFPGAVQTLYTASKAGLWQGDTAVFVTDDVTPCARKFLSSAATFLVDISDAEWVGRAYGGGAKTTRTHYAKLALFTDERFRMYDRILYLDADISVREPLAGLISKIPADCIDALLAVDVYAYDSLYRELSVPASELPPGFRAAHPNRDGVGQTNVMWIFVDRLPPPPVMRARLAGYLDRFGHLVDHYYEQGLLLFAFYNSTVSFGPDAPSAHAAVVAALDHQFHFRLPWMPVVPAFPSFLAMFTAASVGRQRCFQPSILLGTPPAAYLWYSPPTIPIPPLAKVMHSLQSVLRKEPMQIPLCGFGKGKGELTAQPADDPLVTAKPKDQSVLSYCPALPGSVVGSSWDRHYGNIVTVSSFNDTVRVFYMHMEGDRDCDCHRAWAYSVAEMDAPDPERWMYEEYLAARGCTANSTGDLTADLCRSDFPAEGAELAAGDRIGRAGATGPRGVLRFAGRQVRLRGDRSTGHLRLRVGVAVRIHSCFVVVSVAELCKFTDSPRTPGSLCALLPANQ